MSTTKASSIDMPAIPDWASGWGVDEYGQFVEFSLSTGDRYWEYIDQRLRWIPPGSFLMGSPETEQGRFDNEGPQHRVTITNGFWLMETPVTQQLWRHVMGGNPSTFQDAQRPVETVGWPQCTEFCKMLSENVGAIFQLPSEAQWEYACRAGSKEATYAGNLRILGLSNAPALDDIAWYGGNSGVEFDLKTGWDSSEWPEKQFPHATAGSRKVAHKRPNSWGLYDMLGNVWEWCKDSQRNYSAEAVADPMGSTEEGTDRVVRGGGWGHHARFVRAAYRSVYHPSNRGSGLGFRCVCVPAPSAAGAAREVGRRD